VRGLRCSTVRDLPPALATSCTEKWETPREEEEEEEEEAVAPFFLLAGAASSCSTGATM